MFDSAGDVARDNAASLDGTDGRAAIDAGGARDSAATDGSSGDAQARPPDARADALADAPPGIVGFEAYFRFDEGVGTVALDGSGRNRPATLIGGGWAAGRVGPSALSLNGTTDFAQVTGAVVDTSRPYSVAAWVQLSQVGGFRTAVSVEGATVSAFFLQYRADTATFAFAALPSDAPVVASAIARAATSPVAGTWYHLAGVFDGANMSLYLNGVLQQTVPYTTAWVGNGNTVIGRARYTGANADFWPGLIDDVRIYSRALPGAEIAALAAP